MTTTKIGEIRKTETAPAVQAFVQPSELCDTQRRSMAYDAFATLQARGF
ncbi:MAG: hypothetical protein U0531_00135 [Dehalococcoidia bacterium]